MLTAVDKVHQPVTLTWFEAKVIANVAYAVFFRLQAAANSIRP